MTSPSRRATMSMVMEMKRIEAMAITMVRLAAEAGVVLTIEQVSLQPPRMGNYKTVVSVRPARGKS